MTLSSGPRAPECPDARKIVEVLMDYACAAKCPFCYNPPLTPELLAKKLDLAEIAGLLLRKRAEGCDGAWFTGGEVTQREDLPKVLAMARRLGYRRIQIGTNGLRVCDPAYARRLKRAGLNYARVSIHGATAGVHDAILGIPGAFERAARSLDVLREAGVAVDVNFVVCRQNAAELPAFGVLAVGRWKVEVDVLFPHYRGMMVENAATTSLEYRDAAAPAALMFERLAAARLPSASVRLLNFPPCVLDPALRDHVGDWSRGDFEDHELAHPEGPVDALGAMKEGQRAQGEGCRTCALRGDCLGFEHDYARRFGEAEFAPIPSRSA
jgi:MoaA/NifB/PqqE/SkfB family radical SAM enzyme